MSVPSSLTPAAENLRIQIAIAARSLSLGGHDDFNQGQVSARVPGSDYFLIKSAVTGFDECTPSDIIAVSIDPAVPVPSMAPPELPLHQAVYGARPDVQAVVHSHSPYALVFGATDLELRPVSHDGAYFEGRVNRFTMTSNTILDMTVAQGVAHALADNPATLLRNHGSVVVGRSIRHATVFARILERACQLQLIAEQTGVAYHVSSPEDVAEKRKFIHGDLAVRSYWDHCVSQVKRHWPDTQPWGGRHG